MKKTYSKKKRTFSAGSKEVSFPKMLTKKYVGRLPKNMISPEDIPSLDLKNDGLFNYCSQEIFSKYGIWTLEDMELFFENMDNGFKNMLNELTEEEKQNLKVEMDYCKEYLESELATSSIKDENDNQEEPDFIDFETEPKYINMRKKKKHTKKNKIPHISPKPWARDDDNKYQPNPSL